jgi:hypothetical protein
VTVEQTDPIAPPGAGLAARQAALVAALVVGEPTPAGFDPDRIEATRRALLRKRAAEAAKVWPLLAASLGENWIATFSAHRAGTDPVGGLRDGWEVARILCVRGELARSARSELDSREAVLRYDGRDAPRPRRFQAARRVVGELLRRP